jgi:Tol biopolymer transport system component
MDEVNIMNQSKKTRIGLGLLLVSLILLAILFQPSVVRTSSNAGEVYLPVVTNSLLPIIPDTTNVLTEATTQYLISVSANGAVFTFSQNTPELTLLDVGDIMVADVSDAAPYGFLRQVTSKNASGGQVVVNTIPTTLEDAIQQGAISISQQLTPANIESMTTKPGVTLLNAAGSTMNSGFFFEINDVVLYDDDGNPNTTNDQIKVNGSVELAPRFDWDFAIQNWQLQELEFVLNTEETAELEFEIEVEILSLEAYYELATLHLGTITVFVGPVPVVFVIEMPIYLRGDGDVSVGVTTSVTQQANLSAGLRYQQGNWSPIANLNNSFTWQLPTLSAGLDFKGYIDPPLSLLLYGVAGPFAAANPYLELEADVFATPWWKLYGGIDATVGVKGEVLGHSLGEHTEVVVGYRALLAQASGPPGGGTTMRVSVASNGTQGNGDSVSWLSSLSADGRYVTFNSEASNLVSNDTNGARDVFIRDQQTGQTSRVSVASTGLQANGASEESSISADGRYVVFSSYASNLVSGDTNSYEDVFVHDWQAGQTTRVSIASNGVQGNSDSTGTSISADGRYVAFSSQSSNLVSGDTNSYEDVFVHDRQAGQTTRVSIASNGIQGNGNSTGTSISADGRYVVFTSFASNLVGGDTNNSGDVFVHDREAGQTTRVSIASNGVQGNSDSTGTSISADGRYVAFSSQSSNLVSGDTNGAIDAFVHDRQTGQTTRVSIASNGTQGNGGSGFTSISADGRYVGFHSLANNLVSGDTNGAIDAFVHDRQTGQTTRVSISANGIQGNGDSGNTSFSSNGRYVVFTSYASNLISGDTNNVVDVFVRDQGQ